MKKSFLHYILGCNHVQEWGGSAPPPPLSKVGGQLPPLPPPSPTPLSVLKIYICTTSENGDWSHFLPRNPSFWPENELVDRYENVPLLRSKIYCIIINLDTVEDLNKFAIQSAMPCMFYNHHNYTMEGPLLHVRKEPMALILGWPVLTLAQTVVLCS